MSTSTAMGPMAKRSDTSSVATTTSSDAVTMVGGVPVHVSNAAATRRASQVGHAVAGSGRWISGCGPVTPRP